MTTDTTRGAEANLARLSTAASRAVLAFEGCFPALTLEAGSVEGYGALAAAMRDLRRAL